MSPYDLYLAILFGFGAGLWFGYFLYRMPQIRSARKGAETRRRNKELKNDIRAN